MADSLKAMVARALIDIKHNIPLEESETIQRILKGREKYEGVPRYEKICDALRVYAHKAGYEVSMSIYYCPKCKKNKKGILLRGRERTCAECGTVLQRGKGEEKKEEKKSSGFWGNI